MDRTILTADNLHLVSALDLRNEAAAAIAEGRPAELCSWMGGGDSEGGILVWFADAERAGIVTDGESEWTDATSPEQAVDRYESGEMVN